MLSGVAGVISYLGISSLKSLSDATDRMEIAAENALEAQRLTIHLVALTRGQFWMAADPREETIKFVRNGAETETTNFQKRLSKLELELKGADRGTG